jgi:hypothetical protein
MDAVEELSVALPSVLSRSRWMVRNGMIYLGSSSPLQDLTLRLIYRDRSGT